MKKDRHLKFSPLLVCSLALLAFSMLGTPIDYEANEILNPLSPDSEVKPTAPEAIPAPVTPDPEPEKETPETPVPLPEITAVEKPTDQTKVKENDPKVVDLKIKAKKKIFFAPDDPIVFEHEQQARVLDGDESISSTTGRILSSMSGRLLFGSR